MSAFRVSAAGLLRLATEGTLADRVAEKVWMSGVSPAEPESGNRSLAELAQDLTDAGLDQIEVLVECQLPLTSRGSAATRSLQTGCHVVRHFRDHPPCRTV